MTSILRGAGVPLPMLPPTIVPGRGACLLYVYVSLYRCKKINRSHTHSDREQHPRHRHTHTHDKNNSPNLQTNTSHKHLTTLEGGATTVPPEPETSLKVLYSYSVNAIGKIALLSYLSEFRFRVLTAIISDLS